MELFDTSKYEVYSNCDPRQVAGYIPEKVQLPQLKPDQENPRDFQVGDRVIYRGESGTITEVRGVTVRVKFETSEGEGAWLDIQYLTSLTSAQELARDSHSQDSSSEDSNSLDSVSEMISAGMSSVSDSQESTSTQKLTKSQTKRQEELTVSPRRHRASHSQFRENGKGQTTPATASRQLSERSPITSPDTLRSKTSGESSLASTEPITPSDTLAGSLPSYPCAGMMRTGSLYPADTLEHPGLGKDCSWLESPGALSSGTSRKPGLNKLEGSLKNQKILLKGECLNPVFLERGSGLPLGWTDPSELRAATQLLEDDEKRSEMHSIPELQPLLSDEFSTSTVSPSEKECLGKSEKELIPVDESAIGKHFWCDRLTVAVEVLEVRNWRETPRSSTLTKVARCRPWWCFKGDSRLFPDVLVLPLSDLVQLELEDFLVSLPEQSLGTSRPRSNAGRKPGKNYHTGSLYQYTSIKTLKSGERKEFPPVEGERDKLEDSHWYWGFSYIESLAGKRRDKSAPVKGKSLELIRWAIANGLQYQQILKLCQHKFTWYEFQGNWAYGEISAVLPRVMLVNDEEIWISKPSSKERDWGKVREAIADGKSFLEIVEILK